MGNRVADSFAKQLAYDMARNPRLEPAWEEQRTLATAILKRTAFGVAWALGRWPSLERLRERCLPDPERGG